MVRALTEPCEAFPVMLRVAHFSTVIFLGNDVLATYKNNAALLFVHDNLVLCHVGIFSLAYMLL